MNETKNASNENHSTQQEPGQNAISISGYK